MSGDGGKKLGHLRLVPYPREPDVAPAGGGPPGGRGGGGGPPSGGGSSIAGWRIVDDAVVMLDGVACPTEIAGWRTTTHVVQGGPPDWICVRAEPDREAQLVRYVGRGIGHAWLLDPNARTIEVYRFAGAHWVGLTTARGAARLRAEPFADIELDLSAVWDDTN